MNITEPDGDASSGGPATFSLTFSVSKTTDAAYTGTPTNSSSSTVAS